MVPVLTRFPPPYVRHRPAAAGPARLPIAPTWPSSSKLSSRSAYIEAASAQALRRRASALAWHRTVSYDSDELPQLLELQKSCPTIPPRRGREEVGHVNADPLAARRIQSGRCRGSPLRL